MTEDLLPRIAVVEHRVKATESRLAVLEAKIDRVLIAAMISAFGSVGAILAIVIDHTLGK